MSNLIKSNYIYINHDEKRIIDSDLNNNKITTVNFNRNFSVENNLPSSEQFNEGLKVVNMEKLLLEEKALLGEEVDKMMEDARKNAEEIILNAKEQALQITIDAKEDGRKEGYIEGFQEGSVEIEKLEKQLRDEIEKNTKEYEQQLAQVEPTFVEIMIGLIEKITGVVIEDKKEVILHLVNRVMTNTENSRNFIIKVSKDDFVFLQTNKDKIYGYLKDGVQIEVVEDMNLFKNQCIIETDSRIIDCSLDVQLTKLIGDLKLLANIY